jgi:exodeoxyribonuclease VII large subunit
MLIDYVADKRAPTPTGAAEFAVPVKNELISTLNIINNRMRSSIHRYLEEYKTRIEGLARGIPNLEQILNESAQKLDYRLERLQIAMKNMLSGKKNALALAEIKPVYINSLIERYTEKLESMSHRLEGVSVDSVLKRGFAWVKGKNNQTIYSVNEAKKEEILTVRFIDGEMTTEISSAKKTKKMQNQQGSLFDF